jgi:hypothetical protein
MQLVETIRSVLIDYSKSNLNSSAVRNQIAKEIARDVSKEVARYIAYQGQELTKELLIKENRIIELESRTSYRAK